jgi:DNA-binding NtrC family response regulator
LLAESADDAMAQFGDDPGQIDAILLDVNLPGRPSEDVVWAFGRPVPTIGIVLMSGYGPETFEDRFPECLVHRYLRKPFTGEALRQALQHAIDRSA